MTRRHGFPHPGEQSAPRAPDTPQRQVQRPLDDMPILHLEPEIPTIPLGGWTLTVDGLVARPRIIPFEELIGLGSCAANWDVHCVWGWSRELVRWSGVRAAAVVELVGMTGAHVSVAAAGGSYASALTRDEFAAGILATHIDGRPLPAERGGPLRFVPPPHKWAYKGVKWVTRVTATTALLPGFWEQAVGDPRGDIPDDRQDLRFER